jgi:hypothetical protein
MGDRASVSFKKGQYESVALFSHWGGQEFQNYARDYAYRLVKECGGKHCLPLERLEPETIMVDFIRDLTKGEKRVMSNLYLGRDQNDGDNSDNGHQVIDMDLIAKNLA